MKHNRSLILLTVLASIICSRMALADGDLREGQRFEATRDLYAWGVAENLDTRKISIVMLETFSITDPAIISMEVVPSGSVITIVARAPKKLLQFLYPDRYIVRIAGLRMPAGTPAGAPVVLELCCGAQGKSSPLNPEAFKPLP